MQATAKYAEALAHDIADALNHAPHAAGRVTVRYDRAAETWTVRVTIGRANRYDLAMPAAGAMYALWRNGTWLGGLHLCTDAAPIDVATALLDRIAQTVR
ncbi:hypothetical protein QQG74_09335 [Micromonospora sp. FIMYZ51]|uniref:hypothetical protein n=1 Tax=Micromonospora sp. FIMYZ51 TaxID=3051832 RepID=UPI00311DBDCB